MKVWKGLFYCMWMSDKIPIQNELADALARLCHSCQPSVGLVYCSAFFKTMVRGPLLHTASRFQRTHIANRGSFSTQLRGLFPPRAPFSLPAAAAAAAAATAVFVPAAAVSLPATAISFPPPSPLALRDHMPVTCYHRSSHRPWCHRSGSGTGLMCCGWISSTGDSPAHTAAAPPSNRMVTPPLP